jgi:hypothetical protein
MKSIECHAERRVIRDLPSPSLLVEGNNKQFLNVFCNQSIVSVSSIAFGSPNHNGIFHYNCHESGELGEKLRHSSRALGACGATLNFSHSEESRPRDVCTQKHGNNVFPKYSPIRTQPFISSLLICVLVSLRNANRFSVFTPCFPCKLSEAQRASEKCFRD